MELPHTVGCVVCGRENPHGLKLSLHVGSSDDSTVRTEFRPGPHHIGFEGIIHGGLLATVLDEAMVWAATWAGKRFCVAGEMTVRFRQSAAVGGALRVETRVDSNRSRLIQTSGTIIDSAGALVAEASGKYVPVPSERHRHVLTTLVNEPSTADAATLLKEGSR